jgi:hypothetical protein
VIAAFRKLRFLTFILEEDKSFSRFEGMAPIAAKGGRLSIASLPAKW